MLRSNARCRSVRGLSDKRSHPAPRAFRRARAFARRSRLSIRALRGILVGEVARLNPVECVAGERVIIKVAVLRIERDAVRRDLRRTFPLLIDQRSEEHTSELQSRLHLVCRLLLEKKKK